MVPFFLILTDIRSAYNVGAIMRTADAVGASVICCGVTPYPATANDVRPAYIADRATKLIAKTALGAERTAYYSYYSNLELAINTLRDQNVTIYALEQAPSSIDIFSVLPTEPFALVLGPEVDGLNPYQLKLCDTILEIPMCGHKESLNVSAATAVACYQLRRPNMSKQD